MAATEVTLLWMGGVALVMLAFGVLALAGYILRRRRGG